jgi:hypothetical protein
VLPFIIMHRSAGATASSSSTSLCFFSRGQIGSICPRRGTYQKYPSEHQATLLAMYRQARETNQPVKYELELRPTGNMRLDVTVHVLPNGKMYQTTQCLPFEGRVPMNAGYRDVGYFDGDSSTEVPLTQTSSSYDWRIYRPGSSARITTTITVPALEAEEEVGRTAGEEEDARLAENQRVWWHYCLTTIDNIGGDGTLNHALHTSSDWMPCGEQQTTSLEEGRDVSACDPPSIQSTIGIVPCTIKYVADAHGTQYATQHVQATSNSAYTSRVRLLRRQPVTESEYAALLSRDVNATNDCCICMTPVHAAEHATQLTCHASSVHSICLRHCEHYGVLRCPVCRAETTIAGSTSTNTGGR